MTCWKPALSGFPSGPPCLLVTYLMRVLMNNHKIPYMYQPLKAAFLLKTSSSPYVFSAACPVQDGAPKIDSVEISGLTS